MRAANNSDQIAAYSIQARELTTRAAQFLKEGNIPEAQQCYGQAMRVFETALATINDMDQHYFIIVKAISIVHLRLAELCAKPGQGMLIAQGHFDSAIRHLRKLPDSDEANQLLAQCHRKYAFLIRDQIDPETQGKPRLIELYELIIHLLTVTLNHLSRIKKEKREAQAIIADTNFYIAHCYEKLFLLTQDEKYNSAMFSHLRAAENAYSCLDICTDEDAKNRIYIQRKLQQHFLSSQQAASIAATQSSTAKPRYKRTHQGPSSPTERPAAAASSSDRLSTTPTKRKNLSSLRNPMRREQAREFDIKLSPETARILNEEQERILDIISMLLKRIDAAETASIDLNVKIDGVACYLLFLSQAMNRYYRIGPSSLIIEQFKAIQLILPIDTGKFLQSVSAFRVAYTPNTPARLNAVKNDLAEQAKLKALLSTIKQSMAPQTPTQNIDSIFYLKQIGSSLQLLGQYVELNSPP